MHVFENCIHMQVHNFKLKYIDWETERLIVVWFVQRG